ncbi:MAG: 7TM receptor with intracellular metal dependent phosphohydrolase [Rhodothermaceae bacterium]|nr:MAG: 7TM receptor with intracellular metal dependent phosphohydrolase [Rhodothermaceae bacterium]
MGLLEWIGLRSRKARPVGQNLEKGRDDEGPRRRRRTLGKIGIFSVLIVLTLLAFPREEGYRYNVREGEVWLRERLVAPFDFAILKDPAMLAEEREAVRRTTPPIFEIDHLARDKMQANRDTVAAQLERIFSAYAAFLENRLRGRREEASADSTRFVNLRRNARLKLTPAQWQRLANAYVERVPGLVSSTRTEPTGPRLDEELLDQAFAYGMQMLGLGVLDVAIDSVLAEHIEVRDPREHTTRLVEKRSVFGLDEAHASARERFERLYEDDPEKASLAYAFFRVIFQPSLRYLRGETLQAWQRKEAAISPTRGLVRKGETIVEQGAVVDAATLRKIRSLERAQQERSGGRLPGRVLLGQLLLTLATYGFFFLYLFVLRRQIFDENRHVLLIALLFVIIIGLYAVVLRLPVEVMYAVPVIIVSLVLTILFDSRVSLFATLTLAFLGSLMLRFDFLFTFATVFAGALGIFSVRDIKNRGQFFVSAGLVFLGYVFVLVGDWLITATTTDQLLWDVLLVGINAVLLLLAMPLLWVFERAFDITTDLTLLELSDTNRPLLKELSLRAPGTFNHVLQVANLAEAAADAIGANALLTRVGALYHDIGKMVKPEYFVENQRPGQNPHDHLKPRMSALIIASHVKEGLEIGRKYRLPKVVLDFIPMHHGTTRIEYFYRKALEQAGEGDPPVLESEFRYPGPKPNTKETSILMLADSVEAASRTLANPTHKRLESLIDMIIRARLDDGQLEDSELTFRDLTIIKQTFLSMLMAIYHVRVKYPGQEKTQDEEGTTKKETQGEDEGASERATSSEENRPEAETKKGEEGPKAASPPARKTGDAGKDGRAAEALPEPGKPGDEASG